MKLGENLLKKSYTEMLNVSTQLKTWGVQIPLIPIDELNGEIKIKKSLRDFCFHIISLVKNGGVSNFERKCVAKLLPSLIEKKKELEAELRKIENNNSGESSNDSPKLIYWEICGYLRAIECLNKIGAL